MYPIPAAIYLVKNLLQVRFCLCRWPGGCVSRFLHVQVSAVSNPCCYLPGEELASGVFLHVQVAKWLYVQVSAWLRVPSDGQSSP